MVKSLYVDGTFLPSFSALIFVAVKPTINQQVEAMTLFAKEQFERLVLAGCYDVRLMYISFYRDNEI